MKSVNDALHVSFNNLSRLQLSYISGRIIIQSTIILSFSIHGVARLTFQFQRGYKMYNLYSPREILGHVLSFSVLYI